MYTVLTKCFYTRSGFYLRLSDPEFLSNALPSLQMVDLVTNTQKNVGAKAPQ